LCCSPHLSGAATTRIAPFAFGNIQGRIGSAEECGNRPVGFPGHCDADRGSLGVTISRPLPLCDRERDRQAALAEHTANQSAV
jgi:hypothetical protein